MLRYVRRLVHCVCCCAVHCIPMCVELHHIVFHTVLHCACCCAVPCSTLCPALDRTVCGVLRDTVRAMLHCILCALCRTALCCARDCFVRVVLQCPEYVVLHRSAGAALHFAVLCSALLRACCAEPRALCCIVLCCAL